MTVTSVNSTAKTDKILASPNPYEPTRRTGVYFLPS